MAVRTLLLPLLLVVGCADKDWKSAVEADSTQAWLTYAQANAGTARANEALRRAEERAWTDAVAANTSAAYEVYRAKWPSSDRAATAAQKAEALAWDEALSAGSPTVWTAFLARYPASPREAEAEQRLEDAVYETCRLENTEDSWGRYLLRYPKGRHAAEATTVRELLGWQAATSAERPEAYREFLRKYSGGEHTKAAEAWLDATLVRTIQPVVVLDTSWYPEKTRAATLARYKDQIDRGLVPALKRELVVLPTRAVDLAKSPMAHPHEVFPPAPDLGLLVVSIVEKEGRLFEPDGRATDVEATVRLYTPGTKVPVVDLPVRATTAGTVRGADATALHTSAIEDLGGQVLSAVDPVVAYKRSAPR